MQNMLKALTRGINTFNKAVGYSVAWLSIAMMLTTALVVFLRYGLNAGSLMLQDSVTYMHASLFMLGTAYALQQEAHVRVDIFYRSFSTRSKAWIDSLGAIIFLLPLCVFLFFISWNYVAQSWSIQESSADAGGIPAVFLLKSLLLAMPVLLGLQAISQVASNLITLLKEES